MRPPPHALEQLGLHHARGAAGGQALQETAQRRLAFRGHETLEGFLHQRHALAAQQRCRRQVGADNHAVARQRQVTDGRLLVQPGVALQALLHLPLLDLQLGHGRVLDFQLDLADLQLMPLLQHVGLVGRLGE